MFIPCQLYFNYNRFCVCYQQQAFPHLKSLFFVKTRKLCCAFGQSTLSPLMSTVMGTDNIWIKKVLCSRGQGGSLCSKNVVRSRQNIQSLVAFCHWVRDTCQLFDSERVRSISEITPSFWCTYVHATRSRDSPRPCGPGNARKARLPSCSLSTCFSRHTLYMEDHICSITTRCLLKSKQLMRNQILKRLFHEPPFSV